MPVSLQDLAASEPYCTSGAKLRPLTPYADLMQIERGIYKYKAVSSTSIQPYGSLIPLLVHSFIMTVSVPAQPVQVCLSATKQQGTLVSAADASPEDRKRADEAYCSVIYEYTNGPENLLYDPRYMTPHPILISRRFLEELTQFHEALAPALNNIVQRWFTDKEAAFPTRMPLAQHEEELLEVVPSNQS